jgi:hypothetical protein
MIITMSLRRLISTGMVLLVSLLSGCRHQSPRDGKVLASLCDLRERPDDFNGKLIQTEGWIYTDLERANLTDTGCAVAIMWPEDQQRTTDRQGKQFLDLLAKVKTNPFETHEQLFTIVQGRFETQMVRKEGQLVMNGPGYGGGAGSAPSLLHIQKVVCSVVSPLESSTKSEANSRCRKDN